MSKSRLMTVATVALSGVLLSGCGSLAPGVAAKVGDQQLSVRDVDAATASVCAAWEDQSEGQTTPIAMGGVRKAVAQALTLRLWAMEVADDQGVKPGKNYFSQVSQARSEAAMVPAETQDDYLDVITAEVLALDIADQIGQKTLADAGVADATAEEVRAAGLDVFNQWPNAHGVEVDPRYGLKLVDGALDFFDTNASVAVGDTATSALAEDTPAGYVATLPVTHRCG